jgi:hypothetical protein
MSERPTTAAELRSGPGFTRHPPQTTVLSTEGADAGEPHGFDQLETAAFASEYDRCAATWPEIEAWYRAHLGTLGWPEPALVASGEGLLFKREGEQIWVIVRPRRYGMWAPTGAYDVPGTVFQIMYKVSQAG